MLLMRQIGCPRCIFYATKDFELREEDKSCLLGFSRFKDMQLFAANPLFRTRCYVDPAVVRTPNMCVGTCTLTRMC